MTPMKYVESYDDATALRSAPSDAGATSDEGGGPPAPLPAPAVCDEVTPLPQYSRLELRQLQSDADANHAHCWQAISPQEFQVRARSYLRDGQKEPSATGSLCLAVELFRGPGGPTYDVVAARADSPAHTLGLRTTAPLVSIFVVNLVIPAASDGHYQLVLYFGILAETRVAEGGQTPAARLLARFTAGSDAFRNARFKLIPSVAEGPWVVKTGVGSRPSLLGKTLRQRFSRGQTAAGLDYFEAGVDCNSSPAAGRIVSLVKSYARALTVDLAFAIEAQTADELPERVIGCVRLLHVDLGEQRVPSL